MRTIIERKLDDKENIFFATRNPKGHLQRGWRKRHKPSEDAFFQPLDYDYNIEDVNNDYNLVDVVAKKEMKQKINNALSKLKPKEERVLRMRFGIDLVHDYTLEKIAEELNLTRERIRQIEAKAMNKLKKYYLTKEAA